MVVVYKSLEVRKEIWVQRCTIRSYCTIIIVDTISMNILSRRKFKG